MRFSRPLILLCFLLCLVSFQTGFAAVAAKKSAARKNTAAPSQTAGQFKTLDAVIEDAIDQKQCPGAVVLVGHKGKVVYRKAYGMRSLEPTREAMTLDTIFDVASLTKVVATTPSVLRLLELGQIRLNDTVATYLPEFAQNGKQDVTIRQLLTHYSGLPGDLNLKIEWSGKDTAMQMAFAEQLITPPGAMFRYSDINFETLGFLVEKISGMPLDKYADAFVFQPLGMKETRFLPPPAWRRRIAPTEYDENHQMLRGVVHDPSARRMGGVAGHAGLFSTAADLSKYAQALIDAINAKPQRKPFLKSLTLIKATHPEQPPDATTLHVVALRSKVANVVAGALDLGKEIHDKDPLLAITGYNEAAAGSRRMAYRNATVLSGIDVLQANHFDALKPAAEGAAPRRIGVLTNQNGIDSTGRRTIDILNSVPGLKIAALFSPEHGVAGQLDTTQIGNTVDAATGIPVYSVYGDTDAKRRPDVEQLKQVDAVVIDLQDIGVRFWTYEATMGYFLEAAAQAGIEVVVLDRPNPIAGSVVSGPIADPDKLLFTSYYTIPLRHGMTLGELAKLFNGEKNLGAKLTVVNMQGWQRGDWFDSTGQLWVNPSPNMRSLNEATLYPGVGMVEGANVSVGRGTDTPFEVLGAPWIKSQELASYLNNRHISGVRFVPTSFTPTASVYANQQCGGVNMMVTNRLALDATALGAEIAAALHKLYPNDFKMERIARLVANQQTMDDLNAGVDPRFISSKWNEALEAFLPVREKYLIYK
ncbi:MAG: hypothetical protein DMG60_19490 [Acidobacteria bacterium]|nr:MAG: hypothetical protein DMG60_19490 [Acidobacteriota bacterium]